MSGKKSPWQNVKQSLKDRWSSEEYPGAEPRFQIGLLAKDFGVFVIIPFLAVLLFKACEVAMDGPRRPSQNRSSDLPKMNMRESRSQIIEFHGGGSNGSLGIAKRAPGTLIRLRLMNVVDTFGTAPVQAQIIDKGIGPEFLGGILIGDATADVNSNRVNITFRFARQANRPEFAASISARALNMDGTLGVPAEKKEGFFARATLHASTNVGTVATPTNNNDLGSFIANALATGLMQEFGSDGQVAHNNAQVLTVPPLTEFYAELTDFFPGKGK